MKITSAEFRLSAMLPEQCPKDGRPEFAFVGRSNVGKSSLLNTLLARKGLAKTSGRPGKTQTLNFFDINNKFYFVDLPGYGFAEVPVAVKENWGRVMAAYLQERPPLRLVVLLVDARHKPSENDQEMLDLLEDAGVPTLVVATKYDKLKKSEQKPNLARIRETLGLDADALVVPFSCITKEGGKEIWRVVDELLKSPQA